MKVMTLSFDQTIDIINEDHEHFKLVHNGLVDVDDHGDSTMELVFRDADDCLWLCNYLRMKEWGIDKQDFPIDAFEAEAIEVTTTEYAVKNWPSTKTKT